MEEVIITRLKNGIQTFLKLIMKKNICGFWLHLLFFNNYRTFRNFKLKSTKTINTTIVHRFCRCAEVGRGPKKGVNNIRKHQKFRYLLLFSSPAHTYYILFGAVVIIVVEVVPADLLSSDFLRISIENKRRQSLYTNLTDTVELGHWRSLKIPLIQPEPLERSTPQIYWFIPMYINTPGTITIEWEKSSLETIVSVFVQCPENEEDVHRLRAFHRRENCLTPLWELSWQRTSFKQQREGCEAFFSTWN